MKYNNNDSQPDRMSLKMTNMYTKSNPNQDIKGTVTFKSSNYRGATLLNGDKPPLQNNFQRQRPRSVVPVYNNYLERPKRSSSQTTPDKINKTKTKVQFNDIVNTSKVLPIKRLDIQTRPPSKSISNDNLFKYPLKQSIYSINTNKRPTTIEVRLCLKYNDSNEINKRYRSSDVSVYFIFILLALYEGGPVGWVLWVWNIYKINIYFLDKKKRRISRHFLLLFLCIKYHNAI
jgi:hypothetical protein